VNKLNDNKFSQEMKFKAHIQTEKFRPENEIVKLIELFNSLGRT
jgi:hypothetical protein